MPDKVKIGFIGCGFMGQCVHLPSFQKVKNAEIVAICDLRTKLARAVADRWKIKKVFSSHLEMIEDDEINAIVEITNTFVHKPIAIDALKAGKHVFTEKPLTTNTKDAEEMVRTADKHKLKLMVGYMKRCDMGVLKAKEVFEKFAQDDKVTYARSHLFGGDWICGPTAEDMIKTEEKYPEIESDELTKFPDFLPDEFTKVMGWLLNQIHDINLPRYFLGEPIAAHPMIIWPEGFATFLDYNNYPLVLEMGSITADFWEEQLMIYFKNGWIDLRPPPPLLRNIPAKVQIYRAGETQRDESPHGAWSWAFEQQAQHFVDCIIADKKPVSSGADSYRDIAIIESILKATIEGRRKEIESSF